MGSAWWTLVGIPWWAWVAAVGNGGWWAVYVLPWVVRGGHASDVCGWFWLRILRCYLPATSIPPPTSLPNLLNSPFRQVKVYSLESYSVIHNLAYPAPVLCMAVSVSVCPSDIP